MKLLSMQTSEAVSDSSSCSDREYIHETRIRTVSQDL